MHPGRRVLFGVDALGQLFEGVQDVIKLFRQHDEFPQTLLHFDSCFRWVIAVKKQPHKGGTVALHPCKHFVEECVVIHQGACFCAQLTEV
jgi:hypothetical protein